MGSDTEFDWFLAATGTETEASEVYEEEDDPMAPLIRISRESPGRLSVCILGAWSHRTTEQLAEAMEVAYREQNVTTFVIDLVYSDVIRNKAGRVVRMAENWNHRLAGGKGSVRVVLSEPVFESNRLDFPDLFAAPSESQNPPNRVEIEVKRLSETEVETEIARRLSFPNDDATWERYHELVDRNLMGITTPGEEDELAKLNARITELERSEEAEIEERRMQAHETLTAALGSLEEKLNSIVKGNWSAQP